MLLLLLGWGSSAAAAVETHGNILSGFATVQFEPAQHHFTPARIEFDPPRFLHEIKHIERDIS